jgi:hypothetical protein
MTSVCTCCIAELVKRCYTKFSINGTTLVQSVMSLAAITALVASASISKPNHGGRTSQHDGGPESEGIQAPGTRRTGKSTIRLSPTTIYKFGRQMHLCLASTVFSPPFASHLLQQIRIPPPPTEIAFAIAFTTATGRAGVIDEAMAAPVVDGRGGAALILFSRPVPKLLFPPLSQQLCLPRLAAPGIHRKGRERGKEEVGSSSCGSYAAGRPDPADDRAPPRSIQATPTPIRLRRC